MALTVIFFDGFDSLTVSQITRKWSDASNLSSFVSGRVNGNCAVFNHGTSSYLESKSYTPAATWVLSFALYITAHAGASEFLEIKDGVSNVHLALKIDASRHLQLLLGSGGSVIETGATELTLNTWHNIQIKFTIHDTTGNYNVLLNLVQEIEATNVDTRNAGNATVDRFRIKQTDGSTFQFRVDDFVIGTSDDDTNSTDLIGNVHVHTSSPNSAGNATQWTPTTTNYQDVDDTTPDDDSSYVASESPGNDDLYGFNNLSVAGDILCVGLQIVHRIDDTGIRTMKALCRSNGTTTEEGDTISPTTTYGVAQVILQNDPDTTDPWTLSALNAAEFGMRLKT